MGDRGREVLCCPPWLTLNACGKKVELKKRKDEDKSSASLQHHCNELKSMYWCSCVSTS